MPKKKRYWGRVATPSHTMKGWHTDKQQATHTQQASLEERAWCWHFDDGHEKNQRPLHRELVETDRFETCTLHRVHEVKRQVPAYERKQERARGGS